jgi:hypothetical protein
MLKLPTVTAVCFDGTLEGNRRDNHIKIFETFKDKIEFGGGIKYFSHIDPKCEGFADYIHTDPILNLAEYSGVVIDIMPNHVTTDFAMIIHDDGFPINLHLWKPEFLNFDYIGAPWGLEANTYPHQYYNNQVEGGNGGFCIRSAKLMKLAQFIMDKIEHPAKIRDRISKNASFHEDGYICYEIRHFLKQHGCTFAPYNLAKQFSLETVLEDGPNDITKVFGFHGKRHINLDQAIEILSQTKI